MKTDAIALVSAGSKGIGLGIARGLARAGAKVSLCARDETGLWKAADELAAIAGADRVFAMAGDIGDGAFLSGWVEESVSRLGGSADILVNNNGGPPPGGALEMRETQWREAIDRNLMSFIRLAGLVVPAMKQKKWGRIVHIASTTAKEPDEGMALSNVTRAAAASFAKTLAREVAPFGITVNTILTGACMTDRLISLIRRGAEGSGVPLDQAIAKAAASLPVGFIPDPDEFAKTVLFLLSEDARFLTGLSLPVDGGHTKSVF